MLKWAVHTRYIRDTLATIVTPLTTILERNFPMSEAAERVEAWRRAKRQEGYRQVALWLPADFKGKLDALAYARHQDIATCVMEAVEYLEHKQGTLKPLRLDAHQQRRLEEKITTNVLQRLATLGVLDAAAVATEAAGALRPEAPLPVGMKHCKQDHAYPATRAECPHCARARKRRHRQLKAQKRTG
jgi:hypothetical protein